jgi:hypothetical protein
MVDLRLKRRSIYVRPALRTHLARTRVSVSDRLEATAARYEAILNWHLRREPQLTEDQRELLRDFLKYNTPTDALLRRLPHEIRLQGDTPGYRELASRLADVSYAGRVALIESMGL